MLLPPAWTLAGFISSLQPLAIVVKISITQILRSKIFGKNKEINEIMSLTYMGVFDLKCGEIVNGDEMKIYGYLRIHFKYYVKMTVTRHKCM